jgi:hypothetical protein
MNNNYNNLYCDYIGATGSYSISDYIDNTSNFLTISSSNFTSNYANITEKNSSNYTTNKSIITSNAILSRYDPLIKQEIEHITFPIPATLNHTYIYNSNVAGEIRFWCESTSSYPVINPIEVPDYRVKIGPNGHLMCYYTYDPAINLTFGNGWIDVANSIVALNASDANFGISIGGLEIQIQNNFQILQEQLTTLLLALQTNSILTSQQATNINNFIEAQLEATRSGQQQLANVFFGVRNFYTSGQISYLQIAANVITTRIANNPAISFVVGLGGIAFAAFASAIGNLSYAEHTLSQITSNINNMSGITETRRTELLEETRIEQIQSLIDYTSNIYNAIVFQGFINSNITEQQYIPSLKCDTLNLNTGNITNINGITANELITSGKIKENNKFLDATYLTSNHLYNLAYNYTEERRYPSKTFTTVSPETSITLLEDLVYYEKLYLDTNSISYGSGFYEVYSSSTYGLTNQKSKLFNYQSVDTTYPRWGISLYNSGTGNYQGNSTIDNVYYGDWVIIKLPQQIMLTRYRIYQRIDSIFPQKAPSEWKCYGSNDGITFTEIIEASQMTRLISNDYTFGFYEKTLNSSFTTQYQWIGFVFGKLLSVSGNTDLLFSELQIFGKEIISNSIVSNIYTTSNAVKSIVLNDMPNISKQFGFYISITTPIVINNATYYKYDIDLRQYTNLGVIQIGSQSGDTFRSFKIRIMIATLYFSYIINDLLNVCYYDIFMSYKNNAAPPGVAGLNACGIGYPHNPTLQTIMPNNLFIIKNGAGSIDYITAVSTNPLDCRVIISDLLG